MLHMTRVAFGCSSLADLAASIDSRSSGGRVFLTTRYIPKRASEIAGGGSLYWIIKHQLVARADVIGFEPDGQGRHHIILAAKVIPVATMPRRAHQGWRYLEPTDAPRDLMDGDIKGDELPPELIGELAGLSLL
jgi:hypothetical protein